MMIPAQPHDLARLFMVRMVHFRVGVTADAARLQDDVAARFLDVRDGPSDIALPRASIHGMRFPPLPHVGGVAPGAVRLPDPQMCFAAAGADHDLPAIPAKEDDDSRANSNGSAGDEKTTERQRAYIDQRLKDLAAFERRAMRLDVRPRRRALRYPLE